MPAGRPVARVHAAHCTAAAVAGAVSDELVSRRLTPPSLFLPPFLPSFHFILSPPSETRRVDGRRGLEDGWVENQVEMARERSRCRPTVRPSVRLFTAADRNGMKAVAAAAAAAAARALSAIITSTVKFLILIDRLRTRTGRARRRRRHVLRCGNGT